FFGKIQNLNTINAVKLTSTIIVVYKSQKKSPSFISKNLYTLGLSNNQSFCRLNLDFKKKIILSIKFKLFEIQISYYRLNQKKNRQLFPLNNVFSKNGSMPGFGNFLEKVNKFDYTQTHAWWLSLKRGMPNIFAEYCILCGDQIFQIGVILNDIKHYFYKK
ncbi:hypothetical protein BpHYR1_018762, partial [Brachionus plicatilis]